jgi:hypothetical protein
LSPGVLSRERVFDDIIHLSFYLQRDLQRDLRPDGVGVTGLRPTRVVVRFCRGRGFCRVNSVARVLSRKHVFGDIIPILHELRCVPSTNHLVVSALATRSVDVTFCREIFARATTCPWPLALGFNQRFRRAKVAEVEFLSRLRGCKGSINKQTGKATETTESHVAAIKTAPGLESFISELPFTHLRLSYARRALRDNWPNSVSRGFFRGQICRGGTRIPHGFHARIWRALSHWQLSDHEWCAGRGCP